MIIRHINPEYRTKLSSVLQAAGLFVGSVVLEGLDCVGKTTAANILTTAASPRTLLTPRRYHEVPDSVQPSYDYFTLGQYRTFFEVAKSHDVVVDRCHLSSYVFGETLWSQLSFCEEDLPSDLMGVYLYAEPNIVQERMRVKNEPQELFDKYVENQKRYEEVLLLTKIPFVKINTSLTTV